MRVVTILFLVGVFLFMLVGCSSSSQVEVDCDAFQEKNHLTDEIAVPTGDTFQVTLCSNPTTGYEWSEDAQIEDPKVVRQIVQELVIVSDLDATPQLGTPSVQTWTFSALDPGKTIISFDYNQSWEGGEESTWTFKLVATVE